ncbi:D111/G-patch domain-containing protein [Tasmannia lanceolata]|uniref:D111/G-patch domain-containing protein n=1 Tax=Tasmannia lanceolata TaxID=3420 RepID=UPI0040638221
MKLSFSLPPKPSSSKPNNKPTHFLEEKTKNDEETKPQFVTEFDPSKTLTQKTNLIIPPIEDTWRRPEKKMRNIDPSKLPSETDLGFELETPSVLDTDTKIESLAFGLNIMKKNGGLNEPVDLVPPFEPNFNSVETLTQDKKPIDTEAFRLQRFREDLKNLPEDRGFDEFVDMPVEKFAAAYLAGYGWSEGKGIGRNAKEDVKVVQYVRRAGKEGLGFTPDVLDTKKKTLVAPKGPDGRTRHVVGIDEKLVPREVRGVFVGKSVRIIDGRHVGLKGKVVEKLGNSVSDVVVLKLSRSGEEVRVGLAEVAEVGSVEEEKCLRKLKELKVRGKDDGNYREKRDGGKEERRKDKRNGEERGREDVAKSDNRNSQSSCINGDRREEEKVPISWLRSHIRVRIVSKDFRGGRFYLKKGEVMDVVGPTTCDISMDENKAIIQGVDQDILETALPKRGGPVLVLYGKHKGVFGNLVERDMDKEIGIVRDADSHALLTVRLEQIAEYVGDPSYIGY